MDGNIQSVMTTTLSVPEPAVAGSYVNRDLSWLRFNRRVLHEALDDRTPLLERVRFLSIFSSNLDEFFMKRIGRLKNQEVTGLVSRAYDDLSPQQVRAALRQLLLPMLRHQSDCFAQQMRPRLAEHGIHLLRWDQLSDAELQVATRFFRTNV